MDRGGDRPAILAGLPRVQPRWIVRLRGDRSLIGPDGTRQSTNAWADWALQHCTERGRAEDGKRLLGQIWHLERFLTPSFLALERMLWCIVLAGGFVAILQRHHPRVRELLERQVLYHSKLFKISGYPNRTSPTNSAEEAYLMVPLTL